MGRWEPDARGRLQQAALDLFVEQGYDATTVAQIADRAGLTERTFFRHFADKREVLFAGSAELLELLRLTTLEAPVDASPLQAVAGALVAVAAVIQARGRGAQKRQSVIAANPELQERELIKMASWAAVLADALRARGVEDLVTALTAESAVAVFRVAFAQWVEQPTRRDLGDTFTRALEELKAVASGS
jgi:AcrR family transcriptional regulator